MAWKISNLVVFCCCSVCTWWWRILHEMVEFLLRNVWLSWTWNQSTAPYKFFKSHRQTSYWVHLAYGFKISNINFECILQNDPIKLYMNWMLWSYWYEYDREILTGLSQNLFLAMLFLPDFFREESQDRWQTY